MYYRYFSNSEPRPAHYGIRTHREKLIYYDGLEVEEGRLRWEYYDLAADPGENRNAYDDAPNKERIASLKRRLYALKNQLEDHE